MRGGEGVTEEGAVGEVRAEWTCRWGQGRDHADDVDLPLAPGLADVGSGPPRPPPTPSRRGGLGGPGRRGAGGPWRRRRRATPGAVPRGPTDGVGVTL